MRNKANLRWKQISVNVFIREDYAQTSVISRAKNKAKRTQFFLNPLCNGNDKGREIRDGGFFVLPVLVFIH